MSVQPIPETRLAFAKPGASSSVVSYLALHPMGFSVPRHLRFARWSLTPPFHPCRRLLRNTGGLIFCGTVRRKAFQLSARVYPNRADLGYAASRPLVFGLSSSVPWCNESDSPPFQNQLEYNWKKRIYKLRNPRILAMPNNRINLTT